MTGSLSVANPNTVAVRATVAGALASGGACTLTGTDADPVTPGLQLDFAPGASPVAFSCVGANPTATPSWRPSRGTSRSTPRRRPTSTRARPRASGRPMPSCP
ncbi:hypothetical protein G7085_08615 [Tessaracoccus sp. HDW20]|uniref:hypothetical protein n=1 Tax=Tessaracoccus coleopterorum TaxID=2714950 RepID=UPI0018D2E5FC|nr:hypothetical protein [Tessaracoccus coleopterorum]NHB84653.1 hypothetical protein [Tessaracoccus coleopterorum]